MQKPGQINHAILSALANAFLSTFLLIFLFTWLCGKGLVWLVPFIPAQAHFACRFAYMAVPWIGLATLVPAFRLKTR